jgi:nucleoside-diphosphate-sugar epimerase
MNTHLVVGATGGIGRATIKALLERGELVRALVRNRSKAEEYFRDLPPVDIIEGDAGSGDDLQRATAGVATLFYCVNIPYPRWQREARNLLARSVDAAVSARARLVFPGNVYVFGRAQTSLVSEEHPRAAHTRKGRIRAEMESMLDEASRARGLSYVIVRFPDFYGPFVVNGFSEKLLLNALDGKTLRWIGDLDAPYEAVYIEDAGSALVTAGLSHKGVNGTFHVPGPGVTTGRELLGMMATHAENDVRITTYRSPVFFAIAGLFSPLVREVKEMLYLKKERFILSGARYTSTFGPYPATPYSEGIGKSLDWARAFQLNHQ